MEELPDDYADVRQLSQPVPPVTQPIPAKEAELERYTAIRPKGYGDEEWLAAVADAKRLGIRLDDFQRFNSETVRALGPEHAVTKSGRVFGRLTRTEWVNPYHRKDDARWANTHTIPSHIFSRSSTVANSRLAEGSANGRKLGVFKTRTEVVRAALNAREVCTAPEVAWLQRAREQSSSCSGASIKHGKTRTS